jgi:DNA end-binding protein Ku
LDQIDPIFYERTYWLAPSDDAGKKAYQLLLAAMEDRDRAAIGTVVMRNKQYLTAVRPLDGVLAMSTMRFADEVVPRAEAEVKVPKGKVEPKALKMATQLVDALASDWEPEQYHDTYVEELRDRIRAKDEGEEVIEAEEEKPTAKVVDLAAALEESLRSARPTSARRSRSKPKSRTTSGTTRRSPRTRSPRRVRS